MPGHGWPLVTVVCSSCTPLKAVLHAQQPPRPFRKSNNGLVFSWLKCTQYTVKAPKAVVVSIPISRKFRWQERFEEPPKSGTHGTEERSVHASSCQAHW
jgi:hypothetical protein